MLIYESRFFCVLKFLTSSSCTQQMAMSGEGWKTLIKCPQPRTDTNTFFFRSLKIYLYSRDKKLSRKNIYCFRNCPLYDIAFVFFSLSLHLLQFSLHELLLVLGAGTNQKMAGFHFQCLLETRVQSLVDGDSGEFKCQRGFFSNPACHGH